MTEIKPMTFTFEQIEEQAKNHKEVMPTTSEMLFEYAELKRRESEAVSSITDDVVCRADVAQREFFESTHFTGDSERLTHEAMRAALTSVWPASPPSQPSTGVPDGWQLVPIEYVKAVEKASGIASDNSPCIDAVERDGGDDHEDPSCAIHHILYYAGLLLPSPPLSAAPKYG
jgi:hypothetical protein